MAAQSLTTFDASLKDFYEGKIRRVLNRQVRLWNYIKKGQKPFTGRQVLFPINVKGSPASAFMTAGGDLPAAVAQTTVDVKIPIVQQWTRIQVTYDVIEAARDDRGAFERPVALEISRATEDCIDRANIAAWGDGLSVIGTVHSAAGPNTSCVLHYITEAYESGTVNSVFNNQGTRYVKVGDLLDFYTNANPPVVHAQGVQVTAITMSSNTLTLSGGTITNNIAAGDLVSFSQPDLTSPYTSVSTNATKTPMGLGGIVDDGTYCPTLHNVSRTSYPIWKAQVINVGSDCNASAAITLDIMQRLVDLCSEGGTGFPSLMVCHYSVRREILKLMVTDRRYVTPYKYDPGIEEDHMDKWPWPTTLNYDGVPIVFERHCPYQMLFALDNRALRRWVLSDFTWVNKGGNGQNIYLVPGKAGLFEAQGAMLYNLGTDEVSPATCAVARFISSTVDRVQLV